jgi:hypothetical protein
LGFLVAGIEGELAVSCLFFSNRLPGGGITFFAAAKKVIKESSFLTQAQGLDASSELTLHRPQ